MVRRRSSIKLQSINQFNLNTIKINFNIRKFLKTKRLVINRKRLFVVKRRINLFVPFMVLFMCSRTIKNLRNLINFSFFAELQPITCLLLNFYLLNKFALRLKMQLARTTRISGLRTVTSTSINYLYQSTPRTLITSLAQQNLIKFNSNSIRFSLLSLYAINIINEFGHTLPETINFSTYYLVTLKASHAYYLFDYSRCVNLYYLLTQIVSTLPQRQTSVSSYLINLFCL